MKKRLFAICAVLILLVSVLTLIPAGAEKIRFDDSANLVSEDDKTKLIEKLDEVSQKHDLDVVIHTTNSTKGKSIEYYAEDYYDRNGYADDGIILVVDMGSRSYYEVTTGYTMKIWESDGDFEILEDSFKNKLKNGAYYLAFSEFLDEVDFELSNNKATIEEYKLYQSSNSTAKFFLRLRNNLLPAIVWGLIIGLVVALIMTYIEKKKLTSVAFQDNASGYVVKDSFRLTDQRDMFLYRTISRVRINTNNGSRGGGRGGSIGGGGSFGGGRSHGGHGGRF